MQLLKKTKSFQYIFLQEIRRKNCIIDFIYLLLKFIFFGDFVINFLK